MLSPYRTAPPRHVAPPALSFDYAAEVERTRAARKLRLVAGHVSGTASFALFVALCVGDIRWRPDELALAAPASVAGLTYVIVVIARWRRSLARGPAERSRGPTSF